MICDAVEALPQASAAVQVRVTEYAPAHAPAVVASEEVSVSAEPHASEAVAVAKEGVAGQSMVAGEGRDAMTGAVIS